MATFPNAGYNNPALGQAFGDIASLFAPPSPQEQLVAQTLQGQRDAAAAKAAALSQGTPYQQQLLTASGGDPVGASKLAQFYAASSGAPLAAQDPYDYAATGQAGNTIGGRQANMQIAQGNQVVVPAGVLGAQPVTLSNDKPDSEPSLDTTKAGFLKTIAADPNSPAAANARIALGALGGGPSTVINNGAAETAEAAGRGKDAATNFATMQQQAAAAPGNISRLKLLNTVLQKTQTGPLSGAAGTVVGLANQLGISPDTIKGLGLDPNQAVDNSIAGKLAGELVMGSIGSKNGGFPASNFSVAERQFIENTFPNLQAQPGANQAVTDVLTAVQQRALDKSAAYQQYAAQQKAAGKYPDYEGFDQQFQQAHANDDVFSPIAQKFAQGGYSPPGAAPPAVPSNAPSPAAPAAPAPAASGGGITPFNVNGLPTGAPPAAAPASAASPPILDSNAASRAAPGTLFRGHDGKLYRVPAVAPTAAVPNEAAAVVPGL